MSTASTPTQPGWNILSIVGFVLSIVGFNLVAIILGAIGLSQIKRTGERGRGFAIAAIVIGAVSIVLFLIVLLVVLFGVGAGGAGVTY